MGGKNPLYQDAEQYLERLIMLHHNTRMKSTFHLKYLKIGSFQVPQLPDADPEHYRLYVMDKEGALVYEFKYPGRHPKLHAGCRMVKVVILVETVIALDLESGLLQVDTAPLMFRGQEVAWNGAGEPMVLYDFYDETIDLTGGQLANTPVHQFKFEAAAEWRVRDLVRAISPSALNTAVGAIPLFTLAQPDKSRFKREKTLLQIQPEQLPDAPKEETLRMTVKLRLPSLQPIIPQPDAIDLHFEHFHWWRETRKDFGKDLNNLTSFQFAATYRRCKKTSSTDSWTCQQRYLEDALFQSQCGYLLQDFSLKCLSHTGKRSNPLYLRRSTRAGTTSLLTRAESATSSFPPTQSASTFLPSGSTFYAPSGSASFYPPSESTSYLPSESASSSYSPSGLTSFLPSGSTSPYYTPLGLTFPPSEEGYTYFPPLGSASSSYPSSGLASFLPSGSPSSYPSSGLASFLPSGSPSSYPSSGLASFLPSGSPSSYLSSGLASFLPSGSASSYPSSGLTSFLPSGLPSSYVPSKSTQFFSSLDASVSPSWTSTSFFSSSQETPSPIPPSRTPSFSSSQTTPYFPSCENPCSSCSSRTTSSFTSKTTRSPSCSWKSSVFPPSGNSRSLPPSATPLIRDTRLLDVLVVRGRPITKRNFS